MSDTDELMSILYNPYHNEQVTQFTPFSSRKYFIKH